MSFRKPCHMPFRKLIPRFTLTGCLLRLDVTTWWLILSLVLRDNTCLTDFIDNATKLHDTNVESLSRMKDGIEALESWVEHNW